MACLFLLVAFFLFDSNDSFENFRFSRHLFYFSIIQLPFREMWVWQFLKKKTLFNTIRFMFFSSFFATIFSIKTIKTIHLRVFIRWPLK